MFAMLPKLYPFKDQLNPVEFALIKHTHIMPPFPWSLDTWKIQGANWCRSLSCGHCTWNLHTTTTRWLIFQCLCGNYLEFGPKWTPCEIEVCGFPIITKRYQAIPSDTKGQSDTITKVQLKGVKSRSCYGQSGGKLSRELTAGNPGRTADWLFSSFASECFQKATTAKRKEKEEKEDKEEKEEEKEKEEEEGKGKGGGGEEEGGGEHENQHQEHHYHKKLRND